MSALRVRDLTPEGRRVWSAARQLAQRTVADSWKGGGDPELIDIIEENLRVAEQRLLLCIQQLTLRAAADPNAKGTKPC